jgi:hypothetical protein
MESERGSIYLFKARVLFRNGSRGVRLGIDRYSRVFCRATAAMHRLRDNSRIAPDGTIK